MPGILDPSGVLLRTIKQYVYILFHYGSCKSAFRSHYDNFSFLYLILSQLYFDLEIFSRNNVSYSHGFYSDDDAGAPLSKYGRKCEL